MTIFEFIGTFYSQNFVFKLREVLGSEYSFSIPLGSFQTILILQVWDKPEVFKIFQKLVLKHVFDFWSSSQEGLWL
jgi:hypothetical protein